MGTGQGYLQGPSARHTHHSPGVLWISSSFIVPEPCFACLYDSPSDPVEVGVHPARSVGQRLVEQPAPGPRWAVVDVVDLVARSATAVAVVGRLPGGYALPGWNEEYQG